jgi:hypothetical protein
VASGRGSSSLELLSTPSMPTVDRLAHGSLLRMLDEAKLDESPPASCSQNAGQAKTVDTE